MVFLRCARATQRRVAMTHAQRRWLGKFWLMCAAIACLATAQVAAPPSLHAYEDKAGLALDLGYAQATQHGLPHSGAAVGLEASLGLDDIWTVRGAIGYSLHPGTSSLSVLTLGAELLYLVDVLEIVPYFGAGLDAIGSWVPRAAAFSTEFGVHPVFGVDWLISRDWALGLQARPIFLITALNREPIYLTVSVSAAMLLDL
jgi:hypothetical protein